MDPLKARTAATYDAAADHFDRPALSFWNRFARRTVDRLPLRPGATALDVCCGAGASALLLAERVAPDGHVLAVDLAAALLDLARAKAARRGLANVEFRCGDVEALDLPPADAVVCIFGIFFFSDMLAATRRLWSLVRPGGALAITTWGPAIFEPGNGAFWDAIRAERPDLHRQYNPWDRISDPAALRTLLHDAGIAAADVVAEPGEHPLTSADDWWTIALGSGYRGTIDQLDEAARERFRAATLAAIPDVRSLQTNVIYAIARKPAA